MSFLSHRAFCDRKLPKFHRRSCHASQECQVLHSQTVCVLLGTCEKSAHCSQRSRLMCSCPHSLRWWFSAKCPSVIISSLVMSNVLLPYPRFFLCPCSSPNPLWICPSDHSASFVLAKNPIILSCQASLSTRSIPHTFKSPRLPHLPLSHHLFHSKRASAHDHLIPHSLTPTIHRHRVSFKNYRTSLASARVCNVRCGERRSYTAER